MKWNRFTKLLAIIVSAAVGCYTLAFMLRCFVVNDFRFKLVFAELISQSTLIYWVLFMAATLLLWLMYYYKHYWLKNTNRIIKGHRRDSDIKANLENARFQDDKEIQKNFEFSTFETLKDKNITGIPIRAVQRSHSYGIDFAKPAHTLIIGTTGSGKTTTFINPTIQALSESASKSSMLVSDPKGGAKRRGIRLVQQTN